MKSSGRGPEPSLGERAVGYLVPMVICGALGAGACAWLYASGGPRRDRVLGGRDRRVERALDADSGTMKVWAAVGFLLGAGLGAGIARASEKGDV